MSGTLTPEHPQSPPVGTPPGTPGEVPIKQEENYQPELPTDDAKEGFPADSFQDGQGQGSVEEESDDEPAVLLDDQAVETALAQGGAKNLFLSPIAFRKNPPQQTSQAQPPSGRGTSSARFDFIDIDLQEEKPWRNPGVDITDYFNYGFNEDSWREYFKKQAQLRSENQTQGKISVYESRDDRRAPARQPDIQPPPGSGKIAVYESRDDDDRKGRADSRNNPAISDARFRQNPSNVRKPNYPRNIRARDDDTVINLVGSAEDSHADEFSGGGASGRDDFRPAGMGRGPMTGGSRFGPMNHGFRGFYPGGRPPQQMGPPPLMGAPVMRPPGPPLGSSGGSSSGNNSGGGFDRSRDDRRGPPPSSRERVRERSRDRDDRPRDDRSSEHRSRARSPERSRASRDRRDGDRKRERDRREDDRKRPRY